MLFLGFFQLNMKTYVNISSPSVFSHILHGVTNSLGNGAVTKKERNFVILVDLISSNFSQYDDSSSNNYLTQNKEKLPIFTQWNFKKV